MARPAALPSRAIDVLHAIVEAYIEDGEPVASRTISKKYREGLSAASIRNLMADLTDEGYLSQPHTSAGRVPTEKAFRHYVRSLARVRLLSGELERIRTELSVVDDIDGLVQHSSHVLTRMTASVGIAAAIPSSAQTLQHIELVGLPDRKVLTVVVTRDQSIINRIVSLDEELRPGELETVRNFLNVEFQGWRISEIRVELQRRFDLASAAYDQILRQLTVLYQRGLLDLELSPSVHLEGASNLVGLDLHLTREALRDLFRSLEQKKKVLHLLESFLDSEPGEVDIKVGLGRLHPSMEELSLIGLTVQLPNGVAAKVAVLGPIRMNYARVISAVMHVGQAARSLPVLIRVEIVTRWLGTLRHFAII